MTGADPTYHPAAQNATARPRRAVSALKPSKAAVRAHEFLMDGDVRDICA